MLQEQSRFYQQLLFLADMILVGSAWIAAYYLRFEVFDTWPIPLPEWEPLSRYLTFFPWILISAALTFWASGLYVPDRAQRWTSLIRSVAKSVGLALIISMAFLSFYRDFNVSRLTIILFAALTPLSMLGLRLCIYFYVRNARKRGRNLRRVLIVGAGHAGRRLAKSFELYPWMGFQVVGFLDDHKTDEPDVLGKVDEILPLLDSASNPIHYVYIALPLHAVGKIEQLISSLSSRLVHVCLVPDLLQHDIINSRITDVDGLPVLHIIDEAPMDFRRFVKRSLDVVFSLMVLILLSPLLLIIALLVLLSSKGPVLYRQERMGLNGKCFHMLKFRSMPITAEQESGAVWAKKGENRATPVGRILRRTSLDELPQFINVLKGDMSVVGPRPERPVFIKDFKDRIPRYMLRHKMKAGITGWAQVNGWRGNTSLEKRIQHDIYYIQNWSLRLDVKIMILTVWKGFINRNAY
ncbi:MAG: undecaprenyl-phosphate glucose phosphotransferase [Rhodothermaceae bacterium]|nr:undecaprenyl-phosphate glucose phosphotransferase [Bacteroidota bacterium]MXX97992.1 undecaprenyl-phosphate glucose phosphotransferase [Rhodothermaceae bacterium]MXZ58376.1 undecaprenyl-phosphate glucose phosphotransferase [Rhodothermaceae bacterium]MYB90369.1 undecaprenyl-phosphate glucose phosphotransferase [Rhodothermaceae bacterium]MYD67157.1 undecaprenyl-phosphate glucose phosphotransferase [Rhodothermaceae bacterium]